MKFQGHPRSTYYIPNERQYTTLYSSSMVTIPLKYVFKELQPIEIFIFTNFDPPDIQAGVHF